MPRTTEFYAREVDELTQPWFWKMSAGGRCAWDYLKGYVRRAAFSQKRANQAVRLDPEVAAGLWRLAAEDVEEMEREAIKAGRLSVENGDWIVGDKLIFQSAKTVERQEAADKASDLSDKSPQTVKAGEGDPLFEGVCPTNGDERGQLCSKTATNTATENAPEQSKQNPRSELPARAGRKPFNEAGFNRWFDKKFVPAYPRRHGDFEFPDARKRLAAAFKSRKTDPETVLAKLAAYSRICDEQGITGTSMVKMASTWVSKKGWESEYGDAPAAKPVVAGSFADDTADLVRRTQEFFNAA